jgi:hypothetical protein
MGIPVLRTERLVLREPGLAGAPAVLVFRGEQRASSGLLPTDRQ